MATLVWVVVAIVVIAVIALGAVVARNRRTAMLRDRFGPEYDRVVESRDDKRAAETELLARQKQRAQFDVKPLPEADRLRFAADWRELQERFLDEPAEAAEAAGALITRVMEARGYPMRDFDAQAELVSVDYPETVENYRFAHDVLQRSQTQQASTEDLREVMLRYRSLFDDLLRPAGEDAGTAAGQAQPASSNGRQHVTAGLDPEDTENPEVPENPEDTEVPENPEVTEASATWHEDGLEAEDDDALADPAASDLDYRDQQIGR